MQSQSMADIVLTTLNARYWHSSFGLRYLLANMAELTDRTAMLEFGVSERPVDVISTILRHRPKIVGVGVYIWNIAAATQLVADLKRVQPELIVVIGGPEVSYETDTQAIVADADYVIAGEADLAFPALCRRLLENSDDTIRDASSQAINDAASPGERLPQLQEMPDEKVISAAVPDLSQIRLPYHLYNDEDLAHRVIYVEVSRGCPFSCEFCLSALDIPVRTFDLDEFLAAMQELLDRGARQFKFVDRTFNLNIRVSSTILRFFLERHVPELFLHFEMIPDRLPDSIRDIIAKFPDGSLQFEIGVQTFNDEVGRLISRRQNNQLLEDNFRWLRQQTGVHIHADLIIGLPGETLTSFAAGFDRLVALRPHEIQLGMLKRLKGTPIVRHDDEWEMVYSSHAPFEILSNRLIDFETMHRLRRFSRYWDLIANSGNFRDTLLLLAGESSAFTAFLDLSDWLWTVEQRTHTIPLQRLMSRIFQYLTEQHNLPPEQVGPSILRDYRRGGRHDTPAFLKPYGASEPTSGSTTSLPPRQARHTGK